MKIKVSVATGKVLGYLVAKCEGDKLFRACLGRPDDWNGAAYRAGDTTDERWETRVQVANVAWFADYTYNPSINWSQGGPIIEREWINVVKAHDGGCWQAASERWMLDDSPHTGPTPLAAAMRCYVASKLGDEVEVPDALA